MRHILLHITAVAPAGPGICRLTLQDPEGWPLPPARPGAHIDLHLPGGLTRAYSLCGDPAQADRWEIAVKQEAGSRGGSDWLHAAPVGTEVRASLPRCTFPLTPSGARHVMVAGGIGVTPFLPMAHTLARQGAAWRLHVLHRAALPCPDDLAPWLATGHAIAHDTTLAPRPSWETLLGRPTPGVQLYCCGPASMLDGFAAATAGWPLDQARVEHFIPPPLPPAPDARPYVARLAATGRDVAVGAGESLLTAMRSAGVTVDASCEGGVCGACELRWLAGEPIHRDRVLSPARRATHLMACVVRCASDMLVLDA